jgi:hypothetical protein
MKQTIYHPGMRFYIPKIDHTVWNNYNHEINFIRDGEMSLTDISSQAVTA